MKKMSELDLIRSLTQKISCSNSVLHGVGDDTAVLKYTSKHYQLFTTDMLVQDVHFDHKMPLNLVGRKALAVNISDIAAMGGCPQHAVVSLGVPSGFEHKRVQQCYQGLLKLAREFKVNVVGGDVVQAKQLVINIALTGIVLKKHLMLRSKACIGDRIYVTGPLGRSLITEHHLRFQPRLHEAQYLVRYIKPTSMMDVSDGLASDLRQLTTASKVGALIYENDIPRRDNASFKQAMTDGEDFELLFTLPDNRAERMLNKSKINAHYIGKITQKRTVNFVDNQGQTLPLEWRGFDHFS